MFWHGSPVVQENAIVTNENKIYWSGQCFESAKHRTFSIWEQERNMDNYCRQVTERTAAASKINKSTVLTMSTRKTGTANVLSDLFAITAIRLTQSDVIAQRISNSICFMAICYSIFLSNDFSVIWLILTRFLIYVHSEFCSCNADQFCNELKAVIKFYCNCSAPDDTF